MAKPRQKLDVLALTLHFATKHLRKAATTGKHNAARLEYDIDLVIRTRLTIAMEKIERHLAVIAKRKT